MGHVEGHLLDVGNGLGGVEALGAHLRAVENGLAAVELPVVVQEGDTLLGLGVTGVSNPAISLEKHGGSEILVAVPPV